MDIETIKEEALRRLLTVVENINGTRRTCIVCGCEKHNHISQCAVKFATDTVSQLEPEPINSSPVPHYDHAVDGDYSSWLVANNID